MLLPFALLSSPRPTRPDELGDRGRLVRVVQLIACLLVGALTLLACAGARPREEPRRTVVAGPLGPEPPVREDGRLPKLATPLAYELSFAVDPRKTTFSGTTTIVVEVPAPTSYVVVHAHALSIQSAHALVGTRTVPARTKMRPAYGARSSVPEELVLTFAEPLPAGRASLVFAYSAPFDDELSGLYRLAEDERWYVFSQFEATDARRAFPCFDEPAFKVPFDIGVTVPKDMSAVANTREVEHTTTGDKATYRFATTAPLPTYLVALAAGELEIRELEGRQAKPAIRLVTTKGKSAHGALALEATSGLVDALASWFSLPYPYDKLDIVAVPSFASGGMENAGLITFRDDILLLDPARASVRARRSQAVIIAHELAHQWFGNLVTAEWWNDLWLNEGFATWMQSKIVDRWRPSFGARLDAVTAAHGVMDLDALASARAVRQRVVTTSDAQESFDGISYDKGAAVLATIESWIGETAFQRGVRDYLETNAHQSVTSEHLFRALDRSSGRDVSQMASAFLDRPGVPEVTVKMECARGGRWHAELNQEPWRPLGSTAPEETDQTWVLPVCVLAQGEKTPACADLASGAPSLVAGRKCPAWLHPNAASSYYRFALSDGEMLKLAAARAQLDVAGRIALLSNAWAGVRSGKLRPATMLKILAAFDEEKARQPIDHMVNILATMDIILVEDVARPAFRSFVSARLSKRKKALGWEPRPDEAAAGGDEAILRRTILWAMGELAEDESTLREAESYATRWLADSSNVNADTAAVALDLSTRHAGAARLAQLLAAAKNAKTREDRATALRALAGFDDADVLRKALDETLGPAIPAPDVGYVLSAAFGRRSSRIVVEAWLREHWDEMRKKLPGSLGAGLVTGVGVGCTRAELEERAAFYIPRAAGIEGASRLLAESIESSQLCAALRTYGATAITRELRNAEARR